MSRCISRPWPSGWATPGVMVAEVPEDEERLTALDGMYSARWTTTSIVTPGRRRARQYVLFAVPFGD
ncbi:MAG: hypothetical protein IPN03_09875 [Holophagales bacterium]|nr:hypothetical protein [Holophagales bacterium]